jgi:hypothetical protein
VCERVQEFSRTSDGGSEFWVELGAPTVCCASGMLLGTMQEEGPGARVLLVPAVKARATDFSIAAIMARGPRAERRSTCGAAALTTEANHSVGLPTLGKFVVPRGRFVLCGPGFVKKERKTAVEAARGRSLFDVLRPAHIQGVSKRALLLPKLI